MKITTLSEPDRNWIKSLNRREGSQNNLSVMSNEDEERLVKMVKDHSLPTMMFSGVYGFGINVFDHPKNYGDKPECLASMTGFLAFPKRGNDESDQCKHLAPLLTHTPENAEILAYYGMEAQREDFLHHCY